MPRVILFIAAAVTLAMGSFFAWIGWQGRRELARLESLPRWSPAEARQAPEGMAGLLEGVLSDRNPAHHGGFVFYFRSRLDGHSTDDDGNRRPRYTLVDKHLPPLLIEAGGEHIEISGEYAVTFRGSDPSRLANEALRDDKPHKIEGLVAGHPVTVVGKVGSNAEGERILLAKTLSSGTADTLLAGEKSGSRFALIAGSALLVVGLVLVVVAVLL